MKQRNLCILLFIVSLCLLFCACGTKIQNGSGILSLKEVSDYEKLFMNPYKEVKKAFNIQDKDISDLTTLKEQGYVQLNENNTREISGLAFDRAFYFSGNDPQKLSKYRFQKATEQFNELLEPCKAIFNSAMETYGYPSTDPGSGSRLMKKLDSLSEKSFEQLSYGDSWDIGNNTRCYLSISNYNGHYVLALSYEYRETEDKFQYEVGLPTGDDLEKYENLYGKTSEEIIQYFKFRDNDISLSKGEEVVLNTMSPEIIWDEAFGRSFYFTGGDKEALTAFSFNWPGETLEELSSALPEVYAEAVRSYGDPVSNEDTAKSLSEKLNDLTEESIMMGAVLSESWEVGKETKMTLMVERPSYNYYTFSLRYEKK